MFDQCSKVCLWCNSGSNVMGVTNHSLLGVRAHFTKPSLLNLAKSP